MTIAIVGVGETDYAWKDPRPPAAMALDAVRRALDDAGLRASDVDGFVIEALTLPHTAPVDEISQRLGLTDRPFTAYVGLAGSGTVGAPLVARMAIESGQASVVVMYYAISLSGHGRGDAYSYHAGDPAKVAYEMPFGFYGQPVYFAATAARYAHEYGLPEEHLGSIAVSARAHAMRTPNALRREPLTMADYLAQPFLAEPLRKLDCCLVNDGGVAYVMTTVERARDLRHPPAIVAGAGMASKPVTQAQYFSQSKDLLTTAAIDSGRRAFADADLGRADVDFAEIYDCFTISMLLQLEDLGFAPKGEGGAFAASGALDASGRLPTNTHGGLLCQSYMVAANHVVEAVRQIRRERGDGQIDRTDVGLVAGLGAPEHSTLILSTDR
jgi:acetyl-CoA acetyltransferase